MTRRFISLFALALCCCAAAHLQAEDAKVIRIGMVGCDTSHAIAFTKVFNNPKAAGDLIGFRVVAAFPSTSLDIESSRNRVEGYVKQLRDSDVEIVDTMAALLGKVDAVLIESVDGRPHLDQVRPVFEAHKPVFIDKPLAGSLADCIVIAELGKKYSVPWFSASSLRFGPSINSLKTDPKIGAILGCDASSPCTLEPTHPDLFWYGIHGVETLYALMGSGCDTVTRTTTPDTDFAVGVWKDGRIGTFRGTRSGSHGYTAMVFGAKGNGSMLKFEGYEPLVAQIAAFFKTGKAPVSVEETIEVMAFMEAADESKRQHGAAVKLSAVLEKATLEAKTRLAAIAK